ncbi:ATP-binding protein [Nocardioides sediminis]|uniref:ATP-binding protein n=1 Tax=Nocardioides sediminis TaxID=433648 RepID=UPI000D2F4BF5|nr:histidine kinase dimerization/phospho-acceptor domain-containing protein [Nocardioides sediminis]
MRERLTLAFVGLALVIVVVAGLVRAMTLGDIVHASETEDLQQQAVMVGRVVDGLEQSGRPVDADALAGLVAPHVRLEVERAGEPALLLDGPDYVEGEADVRASSTVDGTTVTLVQDATVADDVMARARGPLLALMIGLVVLAGVIGFALASALSRPFRDLAESAAALGRGRFDIEPPRSRIPEVVSISESLRASSQRLQKSLRRDRDFFHHASHVLRTPLTGMRLELEELTLRPDLDDDVRRTTSRCLSDVERLDCTIAELLEFARGRALVEGAEVSLLALGSQIARRWRGVLPESREVKAFIDSGPDVLLTPGPVEQLLDSVLRDVTEASNGPVVLRFAGKDEHVKVTVRSGSTGRFTPGPGPVALATAPTVPAVRANADAARTITEVLGGRYTGDATVDQLEILLPRR